jgi:hypothetical protein
VGRRRSAVRAGRTQTLANRAAIAASTASRSSTTSRTCGKSFADLNFKNGNGEPAA